MDNMAMDILAGKVAPKKKTKVIDLGKKGKKPVMKAKAVKAGKPTNKTTKANAAAQASAALGIMTPMGNK